MQLTAEQRAILANPKALKIVIHTDRDLTPAGKRRALVVKTTRGQQLRFYVGGRLFRWLAPTPENLKMAQEWVKA